MSPVQLIDKYYPQENELKHILVAHSAAVARKALSMAEKAHRTCFRPPLCRRSRLAPRYRYIPNSSSGHTL